MAYINKPIIVDNNQDDTKRKMDNNLNSPMRS